MSDEATYLKQGNGRNRRTSPRCGGFIFGNSSTSLQILYDFREMTLRETISIEFKMKWRAG
jgi:hypothetical protein